MKTSLTIIALILAFILGYQAHKHQSVVVTDVIRDERGLYSVKFIQNGKEYALDYLTEDEYLNLVNP